MIRFIGPCHVIMIVMLTGSTYMYVLNKIAYTCASMFLRVRRTLDIS